MKRFCLYLIKFLPLLVIMPCTAQEQFFRNVYEMKTGSYVEVTSLFSTLPTSGFAPVRVTIANRTAAPAVLSFDFTSSASSEYYSSSRGKLEMKSSFSASAAAGTVSTTDLLVPVAAMVKTASYGQSGQTLSVTMVGVSNGSYTQNSSLSQTFLTSYYPRRFTHRTRQH